MMRRILMMSMILGLIESQAIASLVVNALMKYGVNGATVSGTSQSSSSTTSTGANKSTSSSSSTNSLSVKDKVSLVPGVGIQAVPDSSGVCVGAGIYQDNTMEMSLGWKF